MTDPSFVIDIHFPMVPVENDRFWAAERKPLQASRLHPGKGVRRTAHDHDTANILACFSWSMHHPLAHDRHQTEHQHR